MLPAGTGAGIMAFEHDLSRLSDEELFFLREFQPVDEINAARRDPARLDEIERRLSPRDFFTHVRILLIRAHRHVDAGEFDRARGLLADFLDRHEPSFAKLNPIFFNRFAISVYKLIGDLHVERLSDSSEGSLYYLRIMELAGLKKSPPFTMLVAASRIMLGAALRFVETADRRYVDCYDYGFGLFRYAVVSAYESVADVRAVEIEGRRHNVPARHFFLEISREAEVANRAAEILAARVGSQGPDPA